MSLTWRNVFFFATEIGHKALIFRASMYSVLFLLFHAVMCYLLIVDATFYYLNSRSAVPFLALSGKERKSATGRCRMLKIPRNPTVRFIQLAAIWADSSQYLDQLAGKCSGKMMENNLSFFILSYFILPFYCFCRIDELGAEVLAEMKKQLQDKDTTLTDVRLEALTTAHQVEQLKDAVNKLRVRKFCFDDDNEVVIAAEIAERERDIEAGQQYAAEDCTSQFKGGVADITAIGQRRRRRRHVRTWWTYDLGIWQRISIIRQRYGGLCKLPNASSAVLNPKAYNLSLGVGIPKLA